MPASTEVCDHPELVLLPGFVNPHTHLVLTSLAGQLEPTADFWGWLFDLVDLIRARPPDEISQSLEDGLMLSLASGTTALLDFARPETPSLPPDSPLRVLRADEIITFHPDDDRDRLESLLRSSPALVAPHAVYSTTPDALRRLSNHVHEHGGIFTIHLSETEDENALWLTGESEGLGRYYKRFGIDRSVWKCPRVSPTQCLAELGALGAHTLLVHGNFLSDADIALIAASGATVCFCPATHRFFGRPAHPLPRLVAAGVPVCLGTDSLASAPSLSMWDQVRLVADEHADIEWDALLAMITTTSARALGLEAGHGTLQPGAPADLVLAWPRMPLSEIARAPRELFADDVAIQDVFIGGRSVLGGDLEERSER
jgi:cytosine/adenosine deaminase-related metal-dependent hydrolase